MVASVQSASTSAAMAQQALLGMGATVWQVIAAEFSGTPPAVAQHCATFVAFAQGNLGSLTSSTANAMTSMFVEQQP